MSSLYVHEGGDEVGGSQHPTGQLSAEARNFNWLLDSFTSGTAGVLEAIAVSSDPTAAPKVAVEFARRNDKLQIVGGGLAGTLLDANAVRALAELPSLDELRARLVGLLNAPASRIVGVLQAPAAQVARVLQAFADKQAA